MSELAELKEQVYKDPRPPEHFAPFHTRTRTHRPNVMYELVRIVMSLIAWVFFRAGHVHPERVPAVGPVILAPNHFSFLDHFFLGVALRRKVHFMAKSQLFKKPLQYVYSPGGVFPVRRGYSDDEAFVTAVTVLDRGDAMAMYAEGGRSRTGELAARPRRGIGRLALLSGAPIVPVAIVGSSHVRNWKRLHFPKITVYYGEPFAYERVEAPTRDQEQAAADAIFAEVRALYDKATAGSAA
ncbi:MAG TPA: lysophospholipid acyltransferase family protein [Solirubrobacter sp.]|nr:lysophospholipid acyltransferase family protein [Solirubrobacter sp.]